MRESSVGHFIDGTSEDGMMRFYADPSIGRIMPKDCKHANSRNKG